MSPLNNRDRTLVSLGAAIASNCVPCIEYHIPEARRTGLKDIQIKEAVELADKVRRVPSRTVLEAALAKLDGQPVSLAETSRPECGCNASRDVTESTDFDRTVRRDCE